MLGNGDGTFATAPQSAEVQSPGGIVTDGFNGDGIADLAVVSANAQAVKILVGNGDDTFSLSSAVLPTGLTVYTIGAGDFNGDGKSDIIVTDGWTGAGTLYLSNGDGTFSSQSINGGNNAGGIAIGDFNGDGIPDLATSNSTAITVLLGKGDGTFTAKSTTVAGAVALVAADFNADGKLDVAFVTHSTTASATLPGLSIAGSSQNLQANYPGAAVYSASKSNLLTLAPTQ